MNERTEVLGFEARLLPMVLEAARDHRRHDISQQAAVPPRRSRRRLVLSVGTACVIAAGLLVIPAISEDPRGGALAVEKRGEMFYLRVEDATADPQAMTDELQAAGVDATVSVIPVSPSFERQWVLYFEDEPDGGDADPRSRFLSDQLPTRVLRLQSDYANPLILTVGRPTREGELWEMSHFSDALDDIGPGGAMCRFDLASMTPLEAENVLTQRGYEIQWSFESPNRSGEVSGPPANSVIIYAFLRGPDTISISVSEAGSDYANKALEVDRKAGC